MMEKKNILVITPLYPADDVPKTDTPVVHYFAREWVKDGHRVKVVCLPAVFPSIYYHVASLMRRKISSRLGFMVRTSQPKDRNYEIDGVEVMRWGTTKLIPHSLPSTTQIQNVVSRILRMCQDGHFRPDYVIGHFPNPTLEVMYQLKSHIPAIFCYVAHGGAGVYGSRASELLARVDVIGFRSAYIRDKFFEENSIVKPHFMCYSGIPESFVENGIRKEFTEVRRFLFVGTLISRKYPASLVPAVSQAFGNDFFDITFIGEGNESQNIKGESVKCGCEDRVHLLGRVPREEVRKVMDESDVFIMISEHEVYGLVYLEAMSRGLITIASKREGFDGIIEDGVNGFLCEAGNVQELSNIIRKIRSMSGEELRRMSENAYRTATELTDKKVARSYLQNVEAIASLRKSDNKVSE